MTQYIDVNGSKTNKEVKNFDLWINVYQDGVMGDTYRTKEDADKCAMTTHGNRAVLHVKQTVEFDN